MDAKLTKFKVVGVVSSWEYQRCKFLVQQLWKRYPERFAEPTLRPMLDVAWCEFRDKLRRRNTWGMAPWCTDQPVAVFLDGGGTYLGDSADLHRTLEEQYTLRVYKDFHTLGMIDLKFYLDKSQRPHVYFVISIQGQVIGTLLFQLYYDLVPITCHNFLKLVQKKHGGYLSAPIHRICKSSWVQFGGYKLKPSSIECENYAVPHERRGVLSMCNDGKHKNNSTQFFISLDPTPWMDYFYVAFGQLIHGDAILQRIENTPTEHECPVVPIVIEECGQFTMEDDPSPYLMNSYIKYKDRLAKMQKPVAPEDETYKPPLNPIDIADPRDVASNLSLTKYQQGFYSI